MTLLSPQRSKPPPQLQSVNSGWFSASETSAGVPQNVTTAFLRETPPVCARRCTCRTGNVLIDLQIDGRDPLSFCHAAADKHKRITQLSSD